MDMKDVLRSREKLRSKILKDIQVFEESTGVRVDEVQLVRPVVMIFGNNESVMGLIDVKLHVTL